MVKLLQIKLNLTVNDIVAITTCNYVPDKQIMDDKEGVEAFCNHLVNEFGYVLPIFAPHRESFVPEHSKTYI